MLAMTLAAIGRLPLASDGAEVIVIDNASRLVPTPPPTLANGVSVELLLRATNDGAAARNLGASRASGEWLVMLDDDSYPLDAGFMDDLAEAPQDVAAIGAEIFVPAPASVRSVHAGAGEDGPDGPNGEASAARLIHESGGLPEVFIGCGVAIRRAVFLDAQLGGPGFNGAGYDPAFHYYAEEYDLAARMILSGFRIAHSRRFRVMHHKAGTGRDMNVILRRLVRNNAWVEQRYAPESERRGAIARTLSRYRAIAQKEGATAGYQLGLLDLDESLDSQPRMEMTRGQYERFTGLAAARVSLGDALRRLGTERAMVVNRGKNDWAVEAILSEIGVEIVGEARDADALVVGTLSPGPILDAVTVTADVGRLPVVAPWEFPDRVVGAAATDSCLRAA